MKGKQGGAGKKEKGRNYPQTPDSRTFASGWYGSRRRFCLEAVRGVTIDLQQTLVSRLLLLL